jgi:signal transduction histidine kinase
MERDRGRFGDACGFEPERLCEHLGDRGDAAFALDRDGLLVELNSPAERMLSCTREAVRRFSLAPLLDISRSMRRARTRIGGFTLVAGPRMSLLAGPSDSDLCVIIVRSSVVDEGVGTDDFAQIVHDLRAPLSTMSLETDALEHASDGSDRHDNAVAHIRDSITFLDRMLANLLDLCSQQSGHLELHRERTELRALITTVIERVVAAGDRERVFVDAAESIEARIDDLQIQRVVTNLVTNALKYAPARTRISIGVEPVGGVVRVSVKDAGPGLTPYEMMDVFDKYHRAVRSRSTEGHGLGLFISKQIVEAHGGTIGVESLRGRGSSFFFELPH